ncbi:helix-turn-helix domain-containing protein [Actinoplanes sp. NPDC049118]|uniref:helix-turn-helix domain-containing protein n=1 Tax=Actinoplanes sp. NPDC049118 TaxID=3155769 RepID=UPI0033D9B90F
MTSTTHELGATAGAWNAVIRRARIGRERKAAALVVSSYARADGTRIHCGVARLAVDLEVSYSTARRYLAWLRDVGLIELVRAGNRHRQLSDEYRLILGADVMEHLDVLNPAQHKKLTDDMREANRSGSRERTQRATKAALRSPRMSADESSVLRSSRVSAEDAESAEPLRSPKASAETGVLRSSEASSALTQDERPSLRYISPSSSISPKPSDDEDPGAQLTRAAPAAREEPSPVVEIFPGASTHPPHMPPPRRVSRAEQAIADATARRAQRRAEHLAQLAAEQSTTTEVS